MYIFRAAPAAFVQLYRPFEPPLVVGLFGPDAAGVGGAVLASPRGLVRILEATGEVTRACRCTALPSSSRELGWEDRNR